MDSVTAQKDDVSARSKGRTVVVVGLGMVGIAFIEKLIKYDIKRREFDIVVIGEEPYLAYNRVGLTSFFEHRKVENLYLNPEEWYTTRPEGSLNYHLNTLVTEIHQDSKYVVTGKGDIVHYDILVLATGSNAILPRSIPGHDAKGVFVYRTIDDLQKLIAFSSNVKGSTGVVVGGGLLGLEAAKAMMDLHDFNTVSLIERDGWVLSRQLDEEAGTMVVDLVRKLGLDVKLRKSVRTIEVDGQNNVKGVTFEDGDELECKCLMFAVGISPRDDLARSAGLKCAPRGGVVVGADLSSAADVYAIGECASWENQTFGIIAPGIEMADVLAFNLSQAKLHQARTFKKPDLSTKLKLLGVEVASFGDFFADQNDSKALTYKDPFQSVYKKYLFTLDGKHLLGGMMVGETKDYVRLLPLVKNRTVLEVAPAQLVLGATKEGEDSTNDLPADTQICSCHNVCKGDIVDVIQNGTCKSVDEIKSCTKAGTGCGGCVPLIQTIFESTMKSLGVAVSNHLCQHFGYSRADLFNIISVKRLKDFPTIMRVIGTSPTALGCEICKPAIASILASLYNDHILAAQHRSLQDTNDRFLGNFQRNGTFSVVPRVAGGEITPQKLIVLGNVAAKYGLYVKITGGQRIDMFGAQKHHLLDIWRQLVDAGFESGHAYAKALRTVKSCVGTTWCRYGIGDSVGLAIRLEERYKSIRSPHKIKGGVSGCVRECAEAQSKDFGLVATEKGFNIYVGGNGGAKPRHAEILAKDVPPDEVVPVLDRFLMFYIRTADRLQRTARWIESLPNGIRYLRDVVLNDSLGICADLERQMQELVGSYFCEWKEVLNDAELQKTFRQFANTEKAVEPEIEVVEERSQTRPAYWPSKTTALPIGGLRFDKHVFETPRTWVSLLTLSSLGPFVQPCSRAILLPNTTIQLALFRLGEREFVVSQQMCPHKRAFVLSDGIIGSKLASSAEREAAYVSCPLHKRNFALTSAGRGGCMNDEEMGIATFDAKVMLHNDEDYVYAQLPSTAELERVLGARAWRVRASESHDPFAGLDAKYTVASRKPSIRGHKPASKPVGVQDSVLDW